MTGLLLRVACDQKHVCTLQRLKTHTVLDACLTTGTARDWSDSMAEECVEAQVFPRFCLFLSVLLYSSSLYIFHSPPRLVFCLAVWCTDDMMIVFSMLVDSWQKEVGESGGRACLLLLIICEATSVYQHGTQAGMEGPREGGRINAVMSANLSISSLKWSLSLWLPSLYLFNFFCVNLSSFCTIVFCFLLAKRNFCHRKGHCSGG